MFENKNWCYTGRKTINKPDFKLDSTPLFEGLPTFYGNNRASYNSTWAIQTVLNKHKLPIQSKNGMLEIQIAQADLPANQLSGGCMAKVEN